MIINHTRRFIFVHIPKSAGTSIHRTLEQFTTYRDLELGGSEYGESIQWHYHKRFGLYKHSTCSQIENVIGEEIWESYYKFCFVRNPYSRAYSLYKFLSKWQQGPNFKFISKMSFETFVTSDFFTKSKATLARPQTEWIRKDLSSNYSLDHVGRIENINEDLVHILNVVAPDYTHAKNDLRKDNVSANIDEWKSGINNKTKSIIEKVFEEDFENFNYQRY